MHHEYCWLRNSILDKLMTIKLSGWHRRVLDLVIRETYGRNRAAFSMSQREISKRLRIGRGNIGNLIKELENYCIILCRHRGGTRPTEYRLNENLEEWQTQPTLKRSALVEHGSSALVEHGTSALVEHGTRHVVPIKGYIKKKHIGENTSAQEKADPPENSFSFSFKKILDHLNTKLGGEVFRPGNYHTETMLLDLFERGFGEQDCLDVIDVKCGQWLESETFRKNLRPKTLFSLANFEGYLHEARLQKQQRTQRRVPDTQPDLPAPEEMPTAEQMAEIQTRLRKLGIGKSIDRQPEASPAERIAKLKAQAEALKSETR